MKYFTSHSPHLNEYVLMDWLTEAAARAHGILTTTNYGYLSAVTYNITEHNHCITWNCALAVILVKCIVGNSQALLFHLVKMALEFLRTVHSEWIFKIQTNKTNIKRKNCMLFNGKNMLKVHVCYDSRPDSSSSSSYSHYHCFHFHFNSAIKWTSCLLSSCKFRTEI